MNVLCIARRGEWRSGHSCLPGYKLEAARRSEVHKDFGARRRGEPQTANPVEKWACWRRSKWSCGGGVVEEGGEVLGGGEVRRAGGRERELFIAVSEYAVHKDCSEGYPKEKGATKTGFFFSFE